MTNETMGAEQQTMTVEQARTAFWHAIYNDNTCNTHEQAFDALIAAVRNEILAEFEEVALEFQKDTRGYNPTLVNETLLACSNRIGYLIESIKNEK